MLPLYRLIEILRVKAHTQFSIRFLNDHEIRNPISGPVNFIYDAEAHHAVKLIFQFLTQGKGNFPRRLYNRGEIPIYG